MENKYTEDNIRALEGGEHVRMRPRLYFEKCFQENSLDILPFEVLCHAFDEYFDSICAVIEITVSKNSFSVYYNAGMSLELTKFEAITKAEMIMTRIAACSNQKKHLSVGEEFCHLGMAIINCASSKCKLTTVSEQQKAIFSFEDGKVNSREITLIESTNSWTQIYLEPNKEIFENLSFTYEGIMKKVNELKERLPGLVFNVIKGTSKNSFCNEK